MLERYLAGVFVTGVAGLASAAFTKTSSAGVRRYWTVARTHFSQEQRAAHHIERQGFLHYLPYFAALTRRGAERRELLFPGFIFVSIDLARQWRTLCSTRGVAGLFMCGDVPTRMPKGEVEALQQREDARGLINLYPCVKRGDLVRVGSAGGSLAGLAGAVHEFTSAGRVVLLLTVLGQQKKFEFDARAVELVA
jgi:transcription antitermination factor NusG